MNFPRSLQLQVEIILIVPGKLLAISCLKKGVATIRERIIKNNSKL